MRLVHLGVVFTVVERDEQTAGLVERGRTVRFEDAPTDHRRAVGHIRRTAWRLDDLIERLVAHQYLTEARLPFPPAEGRAGRHDSAGTSPRPWWRPWPPCSTCAADRCPSRAVGRAPQPRGRRRRKYA
ncbi:hypothetical protein ABZ333_10520 [Streptomyces olivaceus]